MKDHLGLGDEGERANGCITGVVGRRHAVVSEHIEGRRGESR